MRTDERPHDALRPVSMRLGFQSYADGSCLIETGKTVVCCSASVQDRVPPFMKGTGQGWVTAEYGMLPMATDERTAREAARGKQSGRTQEIQRLIGRSLRSVVDFAAFADRTVWVDCDVLQADGGTRTASVTGGFVAMAVAFHGLVEKQIIPRFPVRQLVAATSVGIVQGQPMLDLKYDEDSIADVDMNVVMTGERQFVEIQGTAEHAPFGRERLDELLALAEKGIGDLFAAQREALPFDCAGYGL